MVIKNIKLLPQHTNHTSQKPKLKSEKLGECSFTLDETWMFVTYYNLNCSEVLNNEQINNKLYQLRRRRQYSLISRCYHCIYEKPLKMISKFHKVVN